MKKHIIIERDIEFCNDKCPHFYHNFDDFDNVWCARLNKKIYDEYGDWVSFFDSREIYPIPVECTLPDSGE